jgi:hypothetical protein
VPSRSITAETDDVVRTDYYTTDDDGAPAAASGVVLTVTAPDGTTSTPSTTNPATGHYYATKQVTASGLWRLRWTSNKGSGVVHAEVKDAW